MQPDELANIVEREITERELGKRQLVPPPDEISSAIESVSRHFPIVYHDSYMGTSRYGQFFEYLRRFETERQDMSQRVPLKWLNLFPANHAPGLWGFTYIGDTSMGRSDILSGDNARMVDIHESIHTPDEYETRVLTDWILEKPKMKYKK